MGVCFVKAVSSFLTLYIHSGNTAIAFTIHLCCKYKSNGIVTGRIRRKNLHDALLSEVRKWYGTDQPQV